jgi:hypothetical protein
LDPTLLSSTEDPPTPIIRK